MHSVLNVLNILSYELSELSDLLGNENALDASLDFIQSIASSLKNKEKTMKLLATINEKKEKIISNLKEAQKSHAPSPDTDADTYENVRNSIDNILSLLDIFEIRTAEIIIRESRINAWLNHEINELKRRFIEVLNAIEKNSKGRYSIVTDESQLDSKSYLILTSFHSTQEETIFMPPEIQDVMRDLIANARKYTDPGGRIEASLSQTDSELILTVEDNGWGIPEDQIESTIDYGFRGTNARDKKSYGGGFGLTKAYYTTKRYGGQMWIDSQLGSGTKITIKIPLP
jgi:signal transduction histidine kinase